MALVKKSFQRTDRFFFIISLLVIGFIAPVSAETTKKDNKTDNPAAVVINSTTDFDHYTIEKGKVYAAPQGYYLTMLVNGVETPVEPGEYSNVRMAVTRDTQFIGSYPWHGSTATPPFRTGLFIDSNGINSSKSVIDKFTTGSCNSEKADGIVLKGSSGDFSAVIDDNGKYSLNNATICLNGKNADGSNANDFAGLGAAVIVSGDNGVMEISNSDISTEGVGKLALFADNGASLIVKGSKINSTGGKIYDGYISNADQDIMVSPPWVLGLNGTVANARTTNLMGNYSTATYVDSTINAAGWAALSTDSRVGGDPQGWMHLIVINSDVNVDKSGYGAYAIVESQQDYYGVRMNVDTIGVILCGGLVNLENYTAGTPVAVYKLNKTDITTRNSADRQKAFGIPGDFVASVTSSTAEGTVPSVIKSKNFGFELHANSNNEWNVINIKKGTSVKTGDAVFLIKKVNSEINLDGADISSGSNVLVQIMDNDDDYVGLDSKTVWGPDEPYYGHYYKNHMLTFNSKFHEGAGYSSSFAAKGAAFNSGWVCNTTVTDGNYTGDMWNSTGYVGKNGATTLNITIGKNASLTGLISAGEFSHVVKDFTVGGGDWSAAENLGHVTNQTCWNGYNSVNVTVEDGGKWIVTKPCIVSSVNVKTGGKITGKIAKNKDGTLSITPL
jgi:hypothetical protein